MISFFFFFNDTAPTEIYTLSLHDALPISTLRMHTNCFHGSAPAFSRDAILHLNGHSGSSSNWTMSRLDRKSTRLNSSHSQISYAVFCLKKKKSTPARSAAGRMPLCHELII